METLIEILCAGLGTLGFALFLGVRKVHLPLAVLGGTLSWVIYLAAWALCGSYFLSSLVAAALVCLWAETMARIRRAPATVFLIPGIIPLLPGGALYYAMSGIVAGDYALLLEKGQVTLMIAVGIAGGIVMGSEVLRLILSVLYRRRKMAEAKLKAAEAAAESLAVQESPSRDQN